MRPYPGLRAALFGGFFLLGSAHSALSQPTPTEEQKRTAIVEALRDASQCRGAILKEAKFNALKAKAPHFASETAGRRHLQDRSKPTPTAAALVGEYRTRIQPCREKYLARLSIMPSGYVAAYRSSFAKIDAIYVSLEKRETSWGEANAAMAKIQQEATAEASRALK